MSTDYADIDQCSENHKVEGEDSWRTVNCLRGRLLAERMASRNAREEADQLETRLMEVEMVLEQEERSRKRAEKKLRLLRKKLQCINDDKITDRLVISVASSACCGDRDSTTSMTMALVPVEIMSPEKEAVDPEILDVTVRQVLESLRLAKEQILSSMDQRRMSSNIIIKVG